MLAPNPHERPKPAGTVPAAQLEAQGGPTPFQGAVSPSAFLRLLLLLTTRWRKYRDEEVEGRGKWMQHGGSGVGS